MRRNWLIAAIALGLAAIVVAAVLIRVRDDDSGSADLEAWASSVCTSVGDWRASIAAAADISTGGLSKESLEQKLDDARAATDELVSELRDLGAPDLESGDELEQTLDDSVDELERDFDALRASADEALQADSPSALLAALTTLGPQFQSLVTDASTLLGQLESAPALAEEARDDLQQAFEESDACRQLRAES